MVIGLGADFLIVFVVWVSCSLVSHSPLVFVTRISGGRYDLWTNRESLYKLGAGLLVDLGLCCIRGSLIFWLVWPVPVLLIDVTYTWAADVFLSRGQGLMFWLVQTCYLNQAMSIKLYHHTDMNFIYTKFQGHWRAEKMEEQCTKECLLPQSRHTGKSVPRRDVSPNSFPLHFLPIFLKHILQ